MIVSRRRRPYFPYVATALAILLLYWLLYWRYWLSDADELIMPWMEGASGDAKDRLVNVSAQFQDHQVVYQLVASEYHRDACARARVLVMIPSAPERAERRRAIRETWANRSNLPADYFVRFVVGAHADADLELDLYVESETHRDLVRYTARDSYRNLYLKTHAIMEWFRRECPSASHLIKADDDAVLHLRRIDRFLAREFRALGERWPRSMFCNVMSGHHPFRNPFSKLYVPFSSYGSFTFPDYCQGGAYMATSHAVDAILAHLHVTKMIPLEDVVYTGIIGERVGVRLHTTPAFCQESPAKCTPDGAPLKAASCGVSQAEIEEEYRRLDTLTCSAGNQHRVPVNAFLVVSSLLVVYNGFKHSLYN